MAASLERSLSTVATALIYFSGSQRSKAFAQYHGRDGNRNPDKVSIMAFLLFQLLHPTSKTQGSLEPVLTRHIDFTEDTVTHGCHIGCTQISPWVQQLPFIKFE